MWQGVGVTRGGLHEVDHMRWVTGGVTGEGVMRGGLCEVGYARWGARWVT